MRKIPVGLGDSPNSGSAVIGGSRNGARDNQYPGSAVVGPEGADEVEGAAYGDGAEE